MTDTVAPVEKSYALGRLTHAEYRAVREWLRAQGKSLWDGVKDTGTVPIVFFHDAENATDRFFVVCPGCGGTIGGILSDQPVSGWDAPRWTVQSEDPLTMAPSLGCGGWKNGSCLGHWWVRDGQLVLAG